MVSPLTTVVSPHLSSRTSLKPSGALRLEHCSHETTTALLGSALSDGRSRWSMCACVIKMRSTYCNRSGVSGGYTNLFGPIVRIEPIDMPTCENRVGSVITRVPKKFMSRVASPRFAIVSELSGHDAGSRGGCEWAGPAFISRGYDLAANTASENRATAAITRGWDRSRRDGWNEIEFTSPALV